MGENSNGVELLGKLGEKKGGDRELRGKGKENIQGIQDLADRA